MLREQPMLRLARSFARTGRAGGFARSFSQRPRRVQSINALLQDSHVGKEDAPPPEVEVVGHVRTIRNQKRRSFVELGDGSTSRVLQALLEPQQSAGLGTGTAVSITGAWQRCPPGKEQTHELLASEVRILGTSDAETYPIQKKYHTPEYLRTIPHLRLRVPFNALVTRIKSECEFKLSEYFRHDGFIRVYPPVITTSDAEGAGEAFSIAPKSRNGSQSTGNPAPEDFFPGPRYLTVSSQLHLEAYVHEHPRVWTLSPTFRAEKSDTPRHLSEFYMLEAELRTESLSDILDHVESLLRYISTEMQGSRVVEELLASEHSSEAHVRLINSRWQGLRRQYWPRITYSDAMKLLQAAHESTETSFKFPPQWSSGLHLEHERFLAAEVGQGGPVFVTDYPRALKPFYMLPSENTSSVADGETVSCFDLLLPDICEVVGGSLREHRLASLEQIMRANKLLNEPATTENVPTEDMSWYLDLRKYGSIPHGGYGLGFDRLIAYLAGVDSVRDVVAWPRYHGRCDG